MFYTAVIFFSDKKSEIVLVSVSANIVSKYTSFVGVDRDSKVPIPQPVSKDKKKIIIIWHPSFAGGCQGSDRMVVGYTATCAISAYYHLSCEF